LSINNKTLDLAFQALVKFYEQANEKEVIIINHPNPKNKEGQLTLCKNTIEMKYDFDTKQPIAYIHKFISVRQGNVVRTIVFMRGGQLHAGYYDGSFYAGIWGFSR